jgi:hypothetical protein
VFEIVTGEPVRKHREFLSWIEPGEESRYFHQPALWKARGGKVGWPAMSTRNRRRRSHHDAGLTIILAGASLDDYAGFRRGRTAPLPHEALDAGILLAETVAVHQILPDGHGITALRQSGFDELPVRLQALADGLRLGCGPLSTGLFPPSGSVDTSMAGFG